MSIRDAASLRRALFALALLALVWVVLITATGGFSTRIAGLRISSRDARNPLLFAVLAAAVACALARPDRRRVVVGDMRWGWQHVMTARRAMASRPWTRWIDLASLIAACGAVLLLQEWARGRPLWVDEEMIALNVRDRTLGQLAGPLWFDQSAPLGWLITQRLVTLACGLGELALRSVPVAFGIAAVGAAAWIGRRWMGAVGAALLVLLCALSPAFVRYAVEFKHYSADIFFGLMLPALVAWAVEAQHPQQRMRRVIAWWVLAAVGQWWAYGALFVTPACAVVLAIALWRADGWRAAAACAACGVGWLAVFASHYLLTLQFPLHNAFLREYWSVALPPAGAGVAATVTWLARQLAPIASNSAGSSLPLLFWTAAIGGSLLARRQTFGYVYAAVAVSAFLLAGIRLVPLYERLSLWAIPAAYVGIALSAESGVALIARLSARARYFRVAAGIVVLALAGWLSVDISQRGWGAIVDGRRADGNHSFDDRTSVRWLTMRLRPDDVVLTTSLGLPAIWWYARVPVSPPVGGKPASARLPLFELSYEPAESGCDHLSLHRALAASARAIVYVGFAFDAVARNFETLLLRELDAVGRVSEVRTFGLTRTRIAVVDLEPASQSAARNQGVAGNGGGCVTVRPAARW